MILHTVTIFPILPNNSTVIPMCTLSVMAIKKSIFKVISLKEKEKSTVLVLFCADQTKNTCLTCLTLNAEALNILGLWQYAYLLLSCILPWDVKILFYNFCLLCNTRLWEKRDCISWTIAPKMMHITTISLSDFFNSNKPQSDRACFAVSFLHCCYCC